MIRVVVPRILLVCALTAALLSVGGGVGGGTGGWGTPATAASCDVGGTVGCGDAEATSGGTGYYTIGGTSCSAYVSSSGWGGACASPGSYYSGGEPPTWEEIIESAPGRRFDPCRVDHLAKGFKAPPPPTDPQERAKGEEWLVRTCMTDYDLNSTYGGDDTRLVIERVWDDYVPEPPWMYYIWGDVEANQSSFPYAMINYGPTPYPVVNSPVFFNVDFQRFDAVEGPVSLGTKESVEVPLGTDMSSGETVYLVARATRVDIKTGDGGIANCNAREDRATQFKVGEDTIEEFAKTTKCKWTYDHSSASQEDDAYDVVARARWVIRYRVGESGPLQMLSPDGLTFVETKMSYQIPVQEVQVRDCVVTNLCERN